MRVEPAPHVFRNEDRRKRFEERRGTGEDRRADPSRSETRARHETQSWFAASFGAQLLGQIAPERVSAGEARRAYQQPEARSPLRPRHTAAA